MIIITISYKFDIINSTKNNCSVQWLPMYQWNSLFTKFFMSLKDLSVIFPFSTFCTIYLFKKTLLFSSFYSNKIIITTKQEIIALIINTICWVTMEFITLHCDAHSSSYFVISRSYSRMMFLFDGFGTYKILNLILIKNYIGI